MVINHNPSNSDTHAVDGQGNIVYRQREEIHCVVQGFSC